MQQFLDDPALVRAMPCMPRCAVWTRGDQIRAQATIGGNIVNVASADGTPLLAHDAEVDLAGWRVGRIVRRRLPLDRFVIGEQDRVGGRRNPGRVRLRGAADTAAASEGRAPPFAVDLAGLPRRPGEARCEPAAFEDVRLAIAGIGPRPLKLSEAEQRLRGAEVGAALGGGGAAGRSRGSRTRQAYRRDVVRGRMPA
jgi:carbon-monoxide dehydrogenase medium subunit/xanthine dehydrogenase FAD-binding subunit